MRNKMVVILIKVLYFSNRIFYSWIGQLSADTISGLSEIVGEIRVRGVNHLQRRGEERLIISGPEGIMTLERMWDAFELNYVNRGGCQRVADELYTIESGFRPWERLKFAKIADIFSFGSIMNGVVV